MDISKKDYQELVSGRAEKSPIVKDCTLAFLIGGGICTLGQFILGLWSRTGLDKTGAATATAMTLVLISVLLTGFGLYGKLARYGGAGTLVPITGFANAVASPAIDYKSEGYVTGTAARMFQVAGPVIVYGTTASVIYGLILWLMQLPL